jgi:hypothetical protein
VGVGCVEAVALGLLLLGAGTVSLGAKGFSLSGVPFGFGFQIRGGLAKVVGVILVALGLAMMVPGFWLAFLLLYHA